VKEQCLLVQRAKRCRSYGHIVGVFSVSLGIHFRERECVLSLVKPVVGSCKCGYEILAQNKWQNYIVQENFGALLLHQTACRSFSIELSFVMALKFVALLVQHSLTSAPLSMRGRYWTWPENQWVRFQASELILSENGRRHTAPALVVIASTAILLAFCLTFFTMLELEYQKSYNYKSRRKASLSLPEIYILKTYGGLWSPVLIDELNIFPLRIKDFPINALSFRSLLVHMSWILSCEKYSFLLILYFQIFAVGKNMRISRDLHAIRPTLTLL
jgi:hypothetical protein